MIDWIALFFNSCWVIGCAILLAKFSVTRWAHHSPSQFLEPRHALFIQLTAYVLIAIGVIGASDTLLWQIVFGVLFLSLIASTWLEANGSSSEHGS